VVHLTWTKGGKAELTTIDGDRVRLRSTMPSAPGARIDGAMLVTGTTVRVKVARCRRGLAEEAGEHVYEIEGRLIDATREVRVELARLVGGAPPS
jgi:hypothetical protein